MTETLIALTSDITAAHVGNNQVPLEQVPTLIENIYNALAGLGRTDEDQNAPRKPAVSIRSSVRPGYVVCLECGRKMSMLKRHLATEHGLSPEEYRTRWNLRPPACRTQLREKAQRTRNENRPWPHLRPEARPPSQELTTAKPVSPDHRPNRADQPIDGPSLPRPIVQLIVSPRISPDTRLPRWRASTARQGTSVKSCDRSIRA